MFNILAKKSYIFFRQFTFFKLKQRSLKLKCFKNSCLENVFNLL